MVLSWSDSALIYSSIRIGIAPIILMNLLCFQRFPLQGTWPNWSDCLSNTLTPGICNYSNVTSVNWDLHLPNIIKIRSSALIIREERFNTKTQGVNSSLANHVSHKYPFINENIITMHLQVLTKRFTGFSDLPLFYYLYINYYPSLRCQVFLSLLPSFLHKIMNFYLLLMQF